MADEVEPTADAPGEEPTAAMDAVPDTDTVVLHITQLTSDEPVADVAWPAPSADTTQAPSATPATPARPPDRQKQWTIGLAATAAAVLLVAVVVVLTNGDDDAKNAPGGTVGTATVITDASGSTVSTDPVATATTSAPGVIPATPGVLVTSVTVASGGTTTYATAPSVPDISGQPRMAGPGGSYAFDQSGDSLAIGGDQTTIVRDTKTGQPAFTVPTPAKYVEFSPDGSLLLTESGTTRVWSTSDGAQLTEIPGYLGRFVLGGEAVVLRVNNATVLRDARTGADTGVGFRWDGKKWAALQILVSPDQQTVVEDGLHVYDAATGQVKYEFASASCGRLDSAQSFSPDSTRLVGVAGCGAKAEAIVVDAATGREILHIADIGSYTPFATFSADGRLIITAGPAAEPHAVQVFDAATGARVALLRLPAGLPTNDPMFVPHFASTSADGRLLAVVVAGPSYVSTVVWNLSTQAAVARIDGLVSATFAPTGTMLAGAWWGSRSDQPSEIRLYEL